MWLSNFWSWDLEAERDSKCCGWWLLTLFASSRF